jgi:hypothetical protein
MIKESILYQVLLVLPRVSSCFYFLLVGRAVDVEVPISGIVSRAAIADRVFGDTGLPFRIFSLRIPLPFAFAEVFFFFLIRIPEVFVLTAFGLVESLTFLSSCAC